MSKKPSSQVQDIQAKIELARQAVSKMPDDALKSVAFQTILQQLLTQGETRAVEKEKAKEVVVPSHQRVGKKGKRPKGPKGRVETLIEEGFFRQKKTLKEIKGELTAHGWHHRLEELSTLLVRLVQEKKLRRLKEPEVKGGKLVWRYSNW